MHTYELPMGRYEITDKVLIGLTPDQRAMFAILCLVLSEIEGLRKVLALAGNQATGLDELDQAEISQRTVFYRLISMKLIEVFKTLRFSGRHNKTDDVDLLRFKNERVLPELEKLEKQDGYCEAKAQRDRMGFHFDLDFFRGLVELPSLQSDHTVFINGDANFQSFPYGEILVSAAFGRSKNGFDLATALEAVELQTKFIQSQIQCFNRIFQAFFDEFLESKIELKSGKIRVPKILVARRGADPFPLFVIEKISP